MTNRAMTNRAMTNIDRGPSMNAGFEIDLNALLHPASAFDHPSDVLNAPGLTRNEKRASPPMTESWRAPVCPIAATTAVTA